MSSEKRVVCFNKDKQGKCMAYKEARCYEGCSARISRIEDKISLLECLLKGSSKKLARGLQEELAEARAVQKAIQEKKYEGWMSCYLEDIHRGERGGQSEQDANNRTSLKQKMKDNRSVDVKPTQAQKAEYKEAVKAWEEEHGKLERLGRTGMSHSKVDSYTGVPICFSDDGVGYCRGTRSRADRLNGECKNCSYLNPRWKK